MACKSSHILRPLYRGIHFFTTSFICLTMGSIRTKIWEQYEQFMILPFASFVPQGVHHTYWGSSYLLDCQKIICKRLEQPTTMYVWTRGYKRLKRSMCVLCTGTLTQTNHAYHLALLFQYQIDKPTKFIHRGLTIRRPLFPVLLHMQCNLHYPNTLGPGKNVRIIESSDNRGCLYINSFMRGPRRSVRIIEVRIIEVSLYHVTMRRRMYYRHFIQRCSNT